MKSFARRLGAAGLTGRAADVRKGDVGLAVRIVIQHDDGLGLAERARHGVLERHLAEARQLVGLVLVRPGDDVREDAAMVAGERRRGLLAAEEDAVGVPTLAVQDVGVLGRQIGGAQPVEGGRPRTYLVPFQVITSFGPVRWSRPESTFTVRRSMTPARHERAFGAVRARYACGLAQLVVDDEIEGRLVGSSRSQAPGRRECRPCGSRRPNRRSSGSRWWTRPHRRKHVRFGGRAGPDVLSRRQGSKTRCRLSRRASDNVVGSRLPPKARTVRTRCFAHSSIRSVDASSLLQECDRRAGPFRLNQQRGFAGSGSPQGCYHLVGTGRTSKARSR